MNLRSFTFGLLCLGTLALSHATGRGEHPDALRVHEWGTFTALQNDAGEALPGINVDDEPVPNFCHQLNRWVLAKSHGASLIFMKGAPERHPYVNLRLETPVLYFYPPANARLPLTITVNAKFNGGWLTEFYPHAVADAPGLKENSFEFGALAPTTIGQLTWNQVQVGVTTEGPATDAHVWLAPRAVKAVSVTVPPQTNRPEDQPESEKYLFYRGVGNRPVPLKVQQDADSKRLTLYSQPDSVTRGVLPARVAGLWLVHVRADSTTAYRRLDPITLGTDTTQALAKVSSAFAVSDYTAAHLAELRDELHTALVHDGLYEDEATAMLKTWERAYFHSPGLRLFFLVPRVWTDRILPLTLSMPAEIERVMVGRIELISPEQRELLAKLRQIRLSDGAWLQEVQRSKDYVKFVEGRIDFASTDITIPEDYRTYLDLGRFRNALVLAEQKVRPTKALAAFIGRYRLNSFVPN